MEPPEQVPGPYGSDPLPERPLDPGRDSLTDADEEGRIGYVLPGSLWALGELVTWLAGLILALSTFMGWYTGSGDGITIAVIGWHTGALGKLVFFIGLAVLALVILREAGIELPATVPESLVVIALGSVATIFVLIRLISIPDQFLPADGRGIGIFISLIAALGVIAAGLVRAAEEL